MKLSFGRVMVAVLLLTLFSNASSAFAMLHPTMGRFMQQDPLGYVDGMNTYSAYATRPTIVSDPTGLTIRIITDDDKFAVAVRDAFQSIIGNCAKLGIPVTVGADGMFMYEAIDDAGKQGVTYKLTFDKEDPTCVCSDCWKDLKAAITDTRTFDIKKESSSGGKPLSGTINFGGNSKSWVTQNDPRRIPEVGPGNTLVWNPNPVRFDIILWHEVIGHGFHGLVHPENDPNNRYKNGMKPFYVDPVIAIENKGRKCLEKLGQNVMQRWGQYIFLEDGFRPIDLGQSVPRPASYGAD